jgi:membrane protease YdiL (CAAX protease family)
MYNPYNPNYEADRFGDYTRPGPEEEMEKQLKEEEVSVFKALFKILALSVIATVAGREMLSNIVWPVLTNMDFGLGFIDAIDFDYFASTVAPGGRTVLTHDSFYLLRWLFSDIIVYSPSLIIFPIAFRKYMNFNADRGHYYFPKWGTLTFFLTMASLSWIGVRITEFIADIFSNVFGTGGLRDVFADTMPATETQWFMMYMVVGITGPIIEEIIYRHMLLKPLRRLGDWQAVVITSLLFGAFHGNSTQFLYTAMAGVVMGIAAVKANSVMPAIWIHIFNNSYVIARSHLWELSEAGRIPLDTFTLMSMYDMVLYGGFLAGIALLVTKKFELTDSNRHIPSWRERTRLAVCNPWIIVMSGVLFLAVYRGS